MNELQLYDFFKKILEKSKVIQGRFVVLTGYSNDLNSDNFDQIFNDAIGGMKDPIKYPLAFMFPPVEMIDEYDDQWNTWKIQIFFMAQPFQGSIGIQNSDFNKNISQHTVEQTWKDMSVCAKNFMRAISLVLETETNPPIQRSQRNRDFFQRYSKVGNDGLAGIGIDTELLLFDDCAIVDYDELNIDFDFKKELHKHHKY